MTTENAAERLKQAAADVRECRDCPLGYSRTNAVPGEGPADARVMLIAEGPGKNEDEQGKPFMGKAGDFLEDLLAMAGLSRDEVFITNMIKCQAPGNRDPQPAEIQACDKHLERQLEIINPELVVTLGRFSMVRFLPGETISKARGKLRRKEGQCIFPVMHPAAGLRRNEFRDRVVEDFLQLPEVIRRAREEPPEDELKPELPPTSVQRSLF
jgi:uracil-DNA glycosylase family 4